MEKTGKSGLVLSTHGYIQDSDKITTQLRTPHMQAVDHGLFHKKNDSGNYIVDS